MPKKWICDKGCHKQITWPEPFVTGNKPVNMDGSPHNCLPGGPDHIAGQVANAPAQAPKTEEPKTEAPKTDQTKIDTWEGKVFDKAEITTLEIIKRANNYVRTLTVENPQELDAEKNRFAFVMAYVINKK